MWSFVIVILDEKLDFWELFFDHFFESLSLLVDVEQVSYHINPVFDDHTFVTDFLVELPDVRLSSVDLGFMACHFEVVSINPNFSKVSII